MCGQATVRIHGKTLKRFKDKVRELTSRGRGKSLKQVIQELNQQFLGWWGYFRLTGSQILPQGTENLDNTEITESCLETMEEPEDQSS